MTRNQRTLRQCYGLRYRTNPVSGRRTAIELLQDRRMLTGYSALEAGPVAAIANIESGLAAINSPGLPRPDFFVAGISRGACP